MSLRRWSFLFLWFALVTHGAETMRFRGSDTLGALLVPTLRDLYHARHPEVVFDIAMEGPSTAFSGLLEGTADIGMAERLPNEAEGAKLAARQVQLRRLVVAHDAIAVVVHPKNPVSGLTRSQVRAIFTGETGHWAAAGGADAPVVVYTRGLTSALPALFRELALDGRDFAPGVLRLTGSDTVESVVATSESSITYAGQAFARGPRLKVLAIDGLLPEAPAYAYRTSLYFYIRSNARQGIRDFVEWVRTSDEGRAALLKLGWLVPP